MIRRLSLIATLMAAICCAGLLFGGASLIPASSAMTVDQNDNRDMNRRNNMGRRRNRAQYRRWHRHHRRHRRHRNMNRR